MRKLMAVLLLFSFSLAQAQIAQPVGRDESAQPERRLPVRRVVLYKNGVGYFEHTGRVRGNQEVTIDFTTAQLNDVLGSLTALDLGKGHITGVSYNSTAPLSERLRALRLPLGEQPTTEQFLGALRGSRVEVRSGTATLAGRLLSVESQERKLKDDTTTTVTTVTVITDDGEMRTFELGPATTLRVLDRDLQEDVTRYMKLLATMRQQDERRMTIATSGSGEREVFVSYVSEVPVWKSTYRIVLPERPGQKPILQGWAVVDNTVGEDWDNVELALVAGAPQSFIQQISQPYYARRPVVPLPTSVMLQPQTHEATISAFGNTGAITGVITDQQDAVIPGTAIMLRNSATGATFSATTDDNGRYLVANVPPGTYEVTARKSGFSAMKVAGEIVQAGLASTQDITLPVASVSETVTVQASNAELQMLPSAGRTAYDFYKDEARNKAAAAPPADVIAGNYRQWLAEQPRADALAAAQDLGELFEYKLTQPITIRKNQSALVPILQSDIEADEVTLWNSRTQHPLRALWLTNSSGLTLDGGSFNVIADGSFAGEGLLDPVKPGERRLVSYAVDLGVRVEAKNQFDHQRVSRVRLAKGILTQSIETRERRVYSLRNEDASPRALVVEHELRPGWKLAQAATVDSKGTKLDTVKASETTANFYRFRVTVAPHSTAQLAIDEFQPSARNYQLTNLRSDEIDYMVQQKSIDPELEQTLRKVLAQKSDIADLDQQIKGQQEQMRGINDDQQRLRENLKALKGSSEERQLVQRYTRELNQQEDRVDSLRKAISSLEQQRSDKQRAFDAMLTALAFDGAVEQAGTL